MSVYPEKLRVDHSGVYRAPRRVITLAKQAKSSGLAWLELKLGRVGSKDEFLAACARQLKFPPHFGGNWDALADCLRDLDTSDKSGWILHLQGASRFAKAAPDDYATALEVLRLTADYWKDNGALFLVLVDGEADLPQF